MFGSALYGVQSLLTFDVGFEVGVLVESVHLSPPVKAISPVRQHRVQALGVEAIGEVAVLQRGDRPSLVYPPVQVLGHRDTGTA